MSISVFELVFPFEIVFVHLCFFSHLDIFVRDVIDKIVRDKWINSSSMSYESSNKLLAKEISRSSSLLLLLLPLSILHGIFIVLILIIVIIIIIVISSLKIRHMNICNMLS